MANLPFFSSVPAQSVPGQLVPGFLDQSAIPVITTYQYLGHYTLYYLDYIDSETLRLLTAVPGNAYAMQVANSRAGLADPPPDGRWVTPGPPSWDQVIFRPDFLGMARRHNSAMQASLIGRYREIPQGELQEKEKVILPPSEASITTANARKCNAELQAKMARGV